MYTYRRISIERIRPVFRIPHQTVRSNVHNTGLGQKVFDLFGSYGYDQNPYSPRDLLVSERIEAPVLEGDLEIQLNPSLRFEHFSLLLLHLPGKSIFKDNIVFGLNTHLQLWKCKAASWRPMLS